MPRKRVPQAEDDFGKRLSSIRHQAGFTQRQLAQISGVSHRMIAYYESRPALAPGHVLTTLAEALGVSVDELVGKKRTPQPKNSQSSQRLKRRLQQLEKLPLKERRELLRIIDTYLEKNRLAQKLQ